MAQDIIQFVIILAIMTILVVVLGKWMTYLFTALPSCLRLVARCLESRILRRHFCGIVAPHGECVSPCMAV